MKRANELGGRGTPGRRLLWRGATQHQYSSLVKPRFNHQEPKDHFAFHRGILPANNTFCKPRHSPQHPTDIVDRNAISACDTKLSADGSALVGLHQTSKRQPWIAIMPRILLIDNIKSKTRRATRVLLGLFFLITRWEKRGEIAMPVCVVSLLVDIFFNFSSLNLLPSN